MPIIVGVRFKRTPKIYYFEAGEHEYAEGCGVLVETARGLEYGTVGLMPTDVEESRIVQPLRPVIRVATAEDAAKAEELEKKRPEAIRTAAERVQNNGLSMKVVDAQYTFDGAKLILYFTAESRVDFRDLVRELASAFKTRIELKQIGARDECKLKGGLGPCGRACCCSDYVSDFAHVTIKMAKTQNLSLNPGKISGLCGRLMCCLSYENEHYAEVNKRMPKIGGEVKVKDGRHGVAIGVNQLKETVTVRFNEGDSFTTESIKLGELSFSKGGAVINAEDDNDAELKVLED
jgi:cell fate regulator YaaT (PSP1 superfamily)